MSEQRPSFRNSFTNWREYDASFATKLRLLARNNWKKARTRNNCCGNHGEPGC
ncbi:MAG TPA: hypothetical protein VFY90_02680 [Tepidiformaceae bacterium]|nr:hypothetical protein [Tepidiformaceae bacterium]